MKKIVLALLLMLFVVAGCSANNQSAENQANTDDNTNEQTNDQTTTTDDSKILIAYFSRSGNTEEIANQINELVGGTLVKIETVEPYPDSYSETVDIAQQELEQNARPAIQNLNIDMNDYDTIFIGYPIWWHDAPMAVYTFLESYDFTGKTVIPFCTSGGSDIDESLSGIEAAVSGATLLEGLTANDSSDVQSWLENIGILQ
ncbi:flavodoxin [uncultured Thomasclavelia sp.]|uniref:flavodoxin n=1 Tax=uncultured Thomasclavelia sp. TaxID=3025759 RepID=UPI0025E05224|nr:flavodoxin [uncultured Thomasclavelia sp.]